MTDMIIRQAAVFGRHGRHHPHAPGVFSEFRGICRAFGKGHARKAGYQEAGCIGTVSFWTSRLL